jgi:hypothetical protein
MVLSVIPVHPHDVKPMVQPDGGQFASRGFVHGTLCEARKKNYGRLKAQ